MIGELGSHTTIAADEFSPGFITLIEPKSTSLARLDLETSSRLAATTSRPKQMYTIKLKL